MNTYGEKVRELILLNGERTFQAEQLGVIIGEEATLEVCSKLTQYGLDTLVNMSVEELKNVGVSEDAAIRLYASFLIAKDFQGENKQKNITPFKILCPEDAASYLSTILHKEKGEDVVVFAIGILNERNEVIENEVLRDSDIEYEPEAHLDLIKRALKHSSQKIIIGRKALEGAIEHSPSDVRLIEKSNEIARLLYGPDIVDYIVVGENHLKFVSLHEKGLL